MNIDVITRRAKVIFALLWAALVVTGVTVTIVRVSAQSQLHATAIKVKG